MAGLQRCRRRLRKKWTSKCWRTVRVASGGSKVTQGVSGRTRLARSTAASSTLLGNVCSCVGVYAGCVCGWVCVHVDVHVCFVCHNVNFEVCN